MAISYIGASGAVNGLGAVWPLPVGWLPDDYAIFVCYYLGGTLGNGYMAVGPATNPLITAKKLAVGDDAGPSIDQVAASGQVFVFRGVQSILDGAVSNSIVSGTMTIPSVNIATVGSWLVATCYFASSSSKPVVTLGGTAAIRLSDGGAQGVTSGKNTTYRGIGVVSRSGDLAVGNSGVTTMSPNIAGNYGARSIILVPPGAASPVFSRFNRGFNRGLNLGFN